MCALWFVLVVVGHANNRETLSLWTEVFLYLCGSILSRVQDCKNGFRGEGGEGIFFTVFIFKLAIFLKRPYKSGPEEERELFHCLRYKISPLSKKALQKGSRSVTVQGFCLITKILNITIKIRNSKKIFNSKIFLN